MSYEADKVRILVGGLDISQADGSHLDRMTSLPVQIRKVYGDGNKPKPNGHCKAHVNLFGELVWEETDEHFRNRLKGDGGSQ